MENINLKIFLYIIIVASAVFHEFAHGWSAYRLGDSTAKNAGRLTLNPIVHLDPFGTVILPLFLLFTSGIFLGWAKPVPYNPHNLRDQKYGSLKVGIAGPAANLIIALILGLFLRFSGYFIAAGILPFIFFQFLALIVYINIFLALFNLLPFPPLDGSKVFADLFPKQWRVFEQIGFVGIFLALVLAFFFLPPAADFFFWIITGKGFSF
ncbi:MAG: site-2 protease family protein [Patescibacteria group bacterium]